MSLAIVLPFHSGDAEQAVTMLDWFADLCGQQVRTCILAHEELTPSADVHRAASRAFSKVEHLLVSTCADGWPISANCYFACVAAEMRGRDPWLWCEGDCVPIHPQTIDRLEGDYQRAGKPCMGPIIPAYVNKSGVWIESGKMLAGVSIYHPNLWDHSPLLRSFRATQNAYAATWKRNPDQRPMPKAFDCYLANEILPASADTWLIQHMGRSREFIRTGGNILCKYGTESRWNPMVQPETVLVHGQKDGSLITLLRAEMNLPAREYPRAPEFAVALPPKPAQPSSRELAWSDERKEDKPAARPPEPVSAPALKPAPAPSNTVDNEAVATLGDARKSIQHWPECRAQVFGLQELQGRYRVSCQCGACSPKLPNGHDWEAMWKQASPVVDNNGSAQHPENRSVDKSGLSHEPHKLVIEGSNPSAAKADSVSTSEAVPLVKLRSKRDILERFPEWSQFTPKEIMRRYHMAVKKERHAREDASAKVWQEKCERLLTAEARSRKLELIELGKGKKGAFLKLRHHAIGLGVKDASALKRDHLLAAILEREFSNPYEEFETAGA